MIAEILAGAAINRLRGSRFEGLFTSTQVSRIVAAVLLSALCAPYIHPIAFVVCACAFWVYMIPGWDFTVFIEHMEPASIQFKPADWILTKIKFPYRTTLQRNIWGGIAMSIRQSLIVLPLGTAWAFYGDMGYLIKSLGFIFMGMAYPLGFWIARTVRKRNVEVTLCEWMAGGVMGWMIGN